MESTLLDRAPGTLRPPLRVRLLGDLDVRLGETHITLDSGRAESLLAYLLLHRHAPQQRQRIAFVLWNSACSPWTACARRA